MADMLAAATKGPPWIPGFLDNQTTGPKGMAGRINMENP
jgi:hypothetical protein